MLGSARKGDQMQVTEQILKRINLFTCKYEDSFTTSYHSRKRVIS